MFRYVTDKKAIKNGMLVVVKESFRNETYVKIGGTLCKVDLTANIKFKDLKKEEIMAIYNSNGIVLCVEYDASKDKILDKDIEIGYDKLWRIIQDIYQDAVDEEVE
jgi:tRNA-binding EMAP/Myf-like protein